MSEGISIINRVVEILGKEGIPPTDSAIVSKLRTINLINEADVIREMLSSKRGYYADEIFTKDEMIEYADKLEEMK